MKKTKKPPSKTFTFLAACVGECCSTPHLIDVKVKADTQPHAYDKAKAKLAKKYDVGDMVNTPYRMEK
jgi:hypothetical protein